MEVGDVVRVINNEARYETYNSYFELHGITSYLDRYIRFCKNGDEGVVIFKGHHHRENRMLYVIELETGLVLVGERGLELVAKGCLNDLPIEHSDVSINVLLGLR